MQHYAIDFLLDRIEKENALAFFLFPERGEVWSATSISNHHNTLAMTDCIPLSFLPQIVSVRDLSQQHDTN